ncbi:hypothetical protein DID88_002729 [Monilinia fructigena]|uniref:Uncharacterized protein n=1 Tax=Monilinia fructigena TaxID=38457 RepID=A0A395IN01_9HELO|nr:hypothetical protein DID88_002729 [Monilinia fructigena]
MLSFTKPNFKLRRINQSLASNPITTPPRHTVGSEKSLSPGAAVDKQEVKIVTEGNEVSQETRNLAPKRLNKVDNQIQGGATSTMRRSGLTGTSSVVFPIMPKSTIELESYMKKGLHKDWISRFINMQRTTKSAQRLELSYEDVKAADWKLQNPTSSSSKMRRGKKS